MQNRLTERESKLMVTKGERGGGEGKIRDIELRDENY